MKLQTSWIRITLNGNDEEFEKNPFEIESENIEFKNYIHFGQRAGSGSVCD